MGISAEMVHLDPQGEGTLQQRIQQAVTAGILDGRYGPGERMPSSRRLAEHLGVSRITVTLAYTELVAGDYLEARGRSGYFVSRTAPRFPPMPRRDAPAGEAVDWGRAIGQRYSGYAGLERPRDWRRFRYPFIYGQVDESLFDHRNWRLCAIRALGHRDFGALTEDWYERDDPMLIDQIRRRILPRRGIVAGSEEILLTLGAQNALWLSAQILLTQRRTVVREHPCYPGIREVLEQSRCLAVPVPVDAQGLPPDGIGAGVDAVFLTPSHHAPTGATMPLERRRALLARARSDRFVIVEDDYDFELSLGQAPVPALKALDDDGRVIYIGSFSKSIFPGLRLGFLVAPAPFIREARALRALILRHPPGHGQRSVAHFLALGHHDAQINRMSRVLRHRRAVLDKAVQAAGLEVAGPDGGGASLWLRAPEGVNTTHLAEALHRDGVLIEPGRVFFGAEDPQERYFRLSCSSIPAERIAEGVALIRAALDRTGPMMRG